MGGTVSATQHPACVPTSLSRSGTQPDPGTQPCPRTVESRSIGRVGAATKLSFLGQTSQTSDGGRTLVVRMVNAAAAAAAVEVTLQGAAMVGPGPGGGGGGGGDQGGTLWLLSGTSDADFNSAADPERVAPAQRPLVPTNGSCFRVQLPPFTVAVGVLPLARRRRTS